MKKLNWYINRLSTMSPLEIGCRLGDQAKKAYEGRFLRDYSPDITLKNIEVNWYIDLLNKDGVLRSFYESFSFNKGIASDLVNHKFSFFSFDKHDFGATIDWHKDYKNNKQAPVRYAKSIDYRDFDAVGDIKYIWEHNRHLHLVAIAKAYYLTGDESYRQEVISQIDSWIEANPYRQGVNWESSLELGIRLISWSWVWHFCGAFDEEFRNRWLGSIYKHCDCISRNLSRFSSANNHLIGEVAGLFIASIVWPFKTKSDKWRQMSFSVLVREMEIQNYTDGVNKEQAVSYQQFVLDFFLLSALLGEKNGTTFPAPFWHRMQTMIEYVAAIMDVRGNVPNIGDADDGYAIILDDRDKRNVYQSLLATGAVRFIRPDFAAKAGEFDEKSFWLLGVDGKKTFDKLRLVGVDATEGQGNCATSGRGMRLKVFPTGGYYVLGASEGTDDEIKIVFDCGPLGFLGIAAHGHADALSFTLGVGGREFFIDPGTYAYHTQKEWRQYFKSTAAHNTIQVDGESQSVSGGNFMWLKKAEAKLNNYEIDENGVVVCGEHDGYLRLPDPVRHMREIRFNNEHSVMEIHDTIDCAAKHIIEQFFHCDETCAVRQMGNKVFRVINDGKKIEIEFDDKVDCRIVRGHAGSFAGWQSKRFDVKNEIDTFVNTLHVDGPSKLTTRITIK